MQVSLPKRKTLCRSRAANLQKILREGERRGEGGGKGGKVGQERWRRREGEVKAKREVKEIKEVSTE